MNNIKCLVFVFFLFATSSLWGQYPIAPISKKNEIIVKRFNNLIEQESKSHQQDEVLGFLSLGKGKQRGSIIFFNGTVVTKTNVVYANGEFSKGKIAVLKDSSKTILTKYFTISQKSFNSFIIDSSCAEWSEGVYKYIFTKKNKFKLQESLYFPDACYITNEHTPVGLLIKRLMWLLYN